MIFFVIRIGVGSSSSSSLTSSMSSSSSSSSSLSFGPAAPPEHLPPQGGDAEEQGRHRGGAGRGGGPAPPRRAAGEPDGEAQRDSPQALLPKGRLPLPRPPPAGADSRARARWRKTTQTNGITGYFIGALGIAARLVVDQVDHASVGEMQWNMSLISECGGGMEVEDGRHFPNELDDGTEPEGWRDQLEAAIRSAVPQVRSAGHAKPSVYTGDCGACLALLHLAHHGALADAPEVVEEALRRLRRAEGRFDARRVTLLEGSPGAIVLQAWAHQQRGEGHEAAACAERLGALAAAGRRAAPGRAGRPARRAGAVRRAARCARVLAAVLRVARQVLLRSGGAHGVAGILLTLLQLPSELAQAGEGSLQLVRDTADKLLSQRFQSGNLPSSAGSHRDRCVHWCHGAPGLVPLLLQMSTVYQDARYLQLALESGEVVWRRGLLRTKGLGLCHGIPGNGYVFLSLCRATGDALWLRRAQHFSSRPSPRSGSGT
ncbi:unnamed protein product [Prorocentrum cordatum]|uniref:Uncharacterized protein n=1 Tax=Prorocentrum cordatum TaxID=2364126 RepID=A0ABN9QNF7_9DINO|nr:unnamed protein product [Polarella glacialis]